MAAPPEKLARSLGALRALQVRGIVAIRAVDLARTHRERLVRNGFLQPVMKGWYIASSPDAAPGDSTAWYTSFWGFCTAYLRTRLGTDWCLSPEQSLMLHAGNRSVPGQLLVRAPRGRNKITTLPYDTSLLEVRAGMPDREEVEELDGMRAFSLPAALVACSARFFGQCPIDARTALASVRDASDVLRRLLRGGHSTVAGRLAGAFRNIGRQRIADDIVEAMRAADFTVREIDPFEARAPALLPSHDASPHVQRIQLMWKFMRDRVLEHFPAAPRSPADVDAYLEQIEDAYATDAYHSLSIEGYQVSPALIEAVRGRAYNPDRDEGDWAHRDALAARGYWQAYQAVRGSIRRILEGGNPGTIADEDHGTWYRELFAPSVAAGLAGPADLAGYRNAPVYIRRSMHVPPSPEAVRDAMPAFFDLLRDETESSVRVVLGHFVLVYIHPYADGNGRMGRFLMNVMLAAAGYPWTVIPVERRDGYMAALEDASVRQDIGPFADFLARLVTEALEGRPAARTPGEKGI